MVEDSDEEKTKLIVKRILHLPIGNSLLQSIANIIVNSDSKDIKNRKIELPNGRIISIKKIIELSKSPMMEMIPSLIEVPLVESIVGQEGKNSFMTREVMMIACANAGGAYYSKAEGYIKEDKELAGLVLSMAGMIRVSYRNKETRSTDKAWRPMRRTKNMTLDERISQVYNVIHEAVKVQKEITDKNMTTMVGDLI